MDFDTYFEIGKNGKTLEDINRKIKMQPDVPSIHVKASKPKNR